MIEIVLTICMLAAPDQCETHRVKMVPPATELTCLSQAPVEMARMIEQRPGWRATRMGCDRAA